MAFYTCGSCGAFPPASTTGKIDGWFNGYIPGEAGYDSNVTLDSVEIKDCSGYGFDPHEQTVNMVIKNSVSHGNSLDGFVADFLSNSTFENNIAYDNDRHGFNVVTSTHDFTMTNNVAYDNGGNGIVVQRGSEDIPSPTNITITGGEVYSNGAEGVLIKLSSEVTVSSVDIHDNASDGVRIYGSNHVEIIDNTLNNNALGNPVPEIIIQSYNDTLGVSGKYFNGSDNTIQGNIITGSNLSTYGVAERNEDGTDRNAIIGNTISHTSNGATLVYGDGSYVCDTVPMTTVQGTAGIDKLTGGTGADTFRFAIQSDSYLNATASFDDTITDFDVTQDKIDFAGLGFTGLGNGHGGTLQVSYSASSNRTYIKDYDADANGNRFELMLSGNLASTLTGSDFVFGESTQQGILYLPSLGQSNARLLRMTEDDNQSGTSMLVTMGIIWGQGEEAAQEIGRGTDKAAAAAATLKVFDYLHAQFGNFTVYMMETGHYEQDAARARGYSEEKIASIVEGVGYVHAAQEAIAAERADVNLAVDYTDLPLRHEVDPMAYPDDVWHLHEESAEIVGQRLADYIANDLGFQGNPNDNNSVQDIFDNARNLISGTDQADTLAGSSGNDTLDGHLGADTMTGGDGNDTYYVDNADDAVIEINSNAVSGGIDSVHSNLAAYTLGNNVERLYIDSTGAANGTGNALDNTLFAAVDAFTFIGSSAFDPANATGQLRFADGILYGSVDADATPEFEIQLVGVQELHTSDFTA